jgi:hypothetical protein
MGYLSKDQGFLETSEYCFKMAIKYMKNPLFENII